MKKTITILFVLICLIFNAKVNAQDQFVGEIKMFAGNFAPDGWAKCEGQLLAISQNTVLFTILGTTYGGNGQTTFALPDLRGRVPMHNGTGPGLTSHQLGEKGGSETIVLQVANLPSHSHPAFGVIEEGNSSSPKSNFPADTKLLDKEYATEGTLTPMNAQVIGNAGDNQPVNIQQPYQVVTFIIALQGIYPSRP